MLLLSVQQGLSTEVVGTKLKVLDAKISRSEILTSELHTVPVQLGASMPPSIVTEYGASSLSRKHSSRVPWLWGYLPRAGLALISLARTFDEDLCTGWLLKYESIDINYFHSIIGIPASSQGKPQHLSQPTTNDLQMPQSSTNDSMQGPQRRSSTIISINLFKLPITLSKFPIHLSKFHDILFINLPLRRVLLILHT